MRYSLDIGDDCVDGKAIVRPFAGATIPAGAVTWSIVSREPACLTGVTVSGKAVQLDATPFGVAISVDGTAVGTFGRSEDAEDPWIRSILDGVCQGIRWLSNDASRAARAQLKAEDPARVAALLGRFEAQSAPPADLTERHVPANRLLDSTEQGRRLRLGPSDAVLAKGVLTLVAPGPKAPIVTIAALPDLRHLELSVDITEPPLAARADRRLRPANFGLGRVSVSDAAGGYVVDGDESAARIVSAVVGPLAAAQAEFLPSLDALRAAQDAAEAAARAEASRWTAAVLAEARARANARQADHGGENPP